MDGSHWPHPARPSQSILESCPKRGLSEGLLRPKIANIEEKPPLAECSPCFSFTDEKIPILSIGWRMLFGFGVWWPSYVVVCCSRGG